MKKQVFFNLNGLCSALTGINNDVIGIQTYTSISDLMFSMSLYLESDYTIHLSENGIFIGAMQCVINK